VAVSTLFKLRWGSGIARLQRTRRLGVASGDAKVASTAARRATTAARRLASLNLRA
jgi:hypothetical protein